MPGSSNGPMLPEDVPDRLAAELAELVPFIVTVYRWFADPFRRTTGTDLQ
jgi:hypothetical protein